MLKSLPKAARYVLQRPQEAVALLVVIDGDEIGLRGRLEEIRQAIRSAGLDDRSLDRMAVCIPARNVETWELWLYGDRDLNEHTDFKNRFHQDVKKSIRRKELVDAWFAFVSEEQRALEESRLPALVHGRAEIKRLQSIVKY